MKEKNVMWFTNFLLRIAGYILMALGVCTVINLFVDEFSISCVILAIVFFIFGHALSQTGKEGSSEENEAQRWLNNYRNEMAEDTRRFQSKKRQKEQLLDQANTLEQQARYGSIFERKSLKNQAEELRRQARNL